MLIRIKILIHVDLRRQAALFEQLLRAKFSSRVYSFLECPWNAEITSQSWLLNPKWLNCSLILTLGESLILTLGENFQMPLRTLKAMETQGKSTCFKDRDDLESKDSKIKNAEIHRISCTRYLSGCSWPELIRILNAPLMYMTRKTDPLMETEDADFPLQGRFLSVLLYTQWYKHLFYET